VTRALQGGTQTLEINAFGAALMFFVLSKLLGFFAIPSNLVVLIGIVGLFLLPTRFARAGRWLHL
jgi:hypothetical protein